MSGYVCYFLETESCTSYERFKFVAQSELGGQQRVLQWWHENNRPAGLIRIVAPDGRVKCSAMGGELLWSEIRKERKLRLKRWSRR